MKYVILGAGGHAAVVLDAFLSADPQAKVDVCFDLDSSKWGKKLLGRVPIENELDSKAMLARYPVATTRLLLGIGSVDVPRTKKKIFQHWKSLGYLFETFVHPSAVVSEFATLGEGVQIMAGAVVQPGAVLHDNVLVNTGAQIDHDCTIGAHTHLAPGVILSGSVVVGESCHLGTRSCVIQSMTIEPETLIRAGLVVR